MSMTFKKVCEMLAAKNCYESGQSVDRISA